MQRKGYFNLVRNKKELLDELGDVIYT